MKSVYRSITAAMFSFFASLSFGQYSITTNGTVLADDLTSGSRVVVDAFLNCSNRVQILIENIIPQEGITTNDVHLTPVYGGNGERLSCWNFDGMPEGATDISVTFSNGEWNVYFTVPPDTRYRGYTSEPEDILMFEVEAYTDGPGYNYNITATRTENPIIGYTLGTQTNKVLAATNDLISASITNGFVSAATATNIVNDLTEGTYLATTGGVVNGDVQFRGAMRFPEENNTFFFSGTESFFVGGMAYTFDEDSYFSLPISHIYDPHLGSLIDVFAQQSITNGLATTTYADTAAADAIAAADTSYRRTIGITNLNQSVQYVNITDTAPTTLAISMPTNGVTKDWMVYITSVTNVSLILPSATWWMSDTAYTNDVPPATPTALWFSQVTDGIFILGRQELTEVTP